MFVLWISGHKSVGVWGGGGGGGWGGVCVCVCVCVGGGGGGGGGAKLFLEMGGDGVSKFYIFGQNYLKCKENFPNFPKRDGLNSAAVEH